MYVRRFNPLVWFEQEKLNADSITELSTSDNELSVWYISDLAQLDDIVLAMALSKDRIIEMFVVWVEKVKVVTCYKISVNEKEGNTKYSRMKDAHRNFCNMSFWEIGYTAEAINKQLEKECYKYYTEGEIEVLLYNAIRDSKLTKLEIDGNKRLLASLKRMEDKYGVLPIVASAND